VDELLVQQALPDRIASHAFEQESLQLTVLCQDEVQQLALESKLASKLAEAGVLPLNRANRSQTAPVAEREAFFVRGESQVNFQDAQLRQVLIRAPASQIVEVVEKVSPPPIPNQMGQFAFEGRQFQDVRPAIDALQSTAVNRGGRPSYREENESLDFARHRAVAPALPEVDNKEPNDGSSLIRGLLRAMGLDEKSSTEFAQKLAVAGEVRPTDVVESRRKSELADAAETAEPSHTSEEKVDSPRESLVSRMSKRLADSSSDDRSRPGDASIARNQPTAVAPPFADMIRPIPDATSVGSDSFMTVVINFVVPDPVTMPDKSPGSQPKSNNGKPTRRGPDMKN
jgi:hypothetical protein